MTKDSQSVHEKLKWKLKFDYVQGQSDKVHKGLDGLQTTVALANNPTVNLVKFLQETCILLAKTFRFRTVVIGLKGTDGLFRYEIMYGVRDEAWKFLKTKSYTEKDFYESKDWSGELIGKVTKIYLVEDDPWIEKDSFNRPTLVGAARKTPADWVEGDYIDTHILGPSGSLLGWIEILGVSDGKMPDVTTMKFLETFAAIIGRRIELRRA